MKLLILVAVISAFLTEIYGQSHMELIRTQNKIQDEIEVIQDTLVKIRKEVDQFLVDVKPSAPVYEALDTLSKNNLTICLDHCKKSIGEEEGANITKPIHDFHTDFMKFLEKMNVRLSDICTCFEKKFKVSGLTPQNTFREILQCAEPTVISLSTEMAGLFDATKVLERFLGNITNRMQFNCLIHLMGEHTPAEKTKSEQMAVACLDEMSRNGLYKICKPLTDEIYRRVRVIKDLMNSALPEIAKCMKTNMEVVRNRLIKEKNFDFDKCSEL